MFFLKAKTVVDLKLQTKKEKITRDFLRKRMKLQKRSD